MQLLITFKKDRITLPLASSHVLQGLIYNAMREDETFSKNVHDEGLVIDGRRFKHFTFSELKGKYEINGKTITYLEKVSLRVSSHDDYFISLLFSHFSKTDSVKLGENEVEIEKVSLENSCIFESEIKVKTISPITVYVTQSDGHTVYFSPDCDEFYRAIEKNAKRKWQATKGETPFDFEIEAAPEARFIKRATRFKDTFITAWHGSFILKGSPEVLTFLSNTGLGSKNSEGFGMFIPQK